MHDDCLCNREMSANPSHFPRNPRSAPTHPRNARYWLWKLQLFTVATSPSPCPLPPQSAPSVFAGRAWQQVLARDPSADGQFVYAVKSTGIYCRPSCPSRRPERKNVTFFPTPALAEAAGFRACLRCEPLRTEPKPDIQADAIRRAANYLSEHAAERTKLDDLAAAAGLGKFALQRGFKRVLGVTPGEFAREQRKERFRTKVRSPRPTSKSPVTDAVYEAGYGSPSRLYEGVAATLGMSPTAMKSGGAGEIIHYATAPAPSAASSSPHRPRPLRRPLRRHRRRSQSSPSATNSPRPPSAPPPRPLNPQICHLNPPQICHLDRRRRSLPPQWRDLQLITSTPPSPSSSPA